MILGLFIRNFKTYQGLKFIPLTDQYNFCGLLGKNGIGKSSVLEALDCFFNNKSWNFNFTVKKSGISKAKPYIVPVFLVEKKVIPSDMKETFEIFDKFFRNKPKNEFNFGGVDASVRDTFFLLRDTLINLKDFDDKYISTFGIDHTGEATSSIFDSVYESEDKIKGFSPGISMVERLRPCVEYIRSKFEYIYIPKDMDSEVFTRIENQEIQILMGEKLDDILKKRITTSAIDEINKELNSFINEISTEIDGYVYRTPTDRQKNLKKSDINKLIIDAFFNIRKLHKKQDENYIEINSLSSGEKQKAIIDVARGLLENHRKDGKNLIIAIDEPESSLHISACFEQFDSLFKMSHQCRQLIFSSHWYGFLPILDHGNVCVISDTKGHHFDLINMNNYREQIEHMIQDSNGALPYDINLKSITDFIQSILANIISNSPYHWILCEGSSEKIYFEAYFSEEIKSGKLRIIPTGGAKKNKRIYQNLLTPYEEIKASVAKSNYKAWGKILFLSDTDEQLVSYGTKSHENL